MDRIAQPAVIQATVSITAIRIPVTQCNS